MKFINQPKNAFIFGLFLAFFGAQAYSAQITVLTENGTPVVGADILVGPSEGTPFIDNKLKTDLNGQAAIPAEWSTSQPVTVMAGGFRAATFLNIAPTDVTLQIHREDAKTSYEVRGETTNYDNLRRDGNVDFTLVYPAMRRGQLAQFDVSQMISSEVDTMTVVSETVAIPSNLSLPEQKENYVLPITLSKPVYRLGFKQSGDFRMTGLHGQFPLRQVVGDLRNGKAFYEVINYFKILGGGQRDVVVNGSLSGQDVPINQLTMKRKLAVQGPNIGDQVVIFSMTMSQANGYYYPTDIKRINPGQTIELVAPTSAEDVSFTSVIMSKADADKIGGQITSPDPVSPINETLKQFYDRFLNIFNITEGGDPDKGESPIIQLQGGYSVVHHPASLNTPNFLGLVPRPIIIGNKLVMTPPAVVEEVEPLATFVQLSEVVLNNNGRYTTESKFRIWEVTQNGWVNEMTLPEFPTQIIPGKKYRWEVLFMGRQKGHDSDTAAGDYFLNAVTHVSRNSIDF